MDEKESKNAIIEAAAESGNWSREARTALLEQAEAVMEDLFLELARAEWHRGGDAGLSKWVGAEFHAGPKNVQRKLMIRLLRTVFEREH
jgi:hypothetical protein